MPNTDTGVYVQFFDETESSQKELPPLGPFELLIIRHNRIIGDREHVVHDMMTHGSVERWLEAELELRRALGDEPGGMRRSHMRIRAPKGDIIVRFYDYTGDEPPKVPELGPFFSLTVGKRDVRADDKLLAIRATDMAPWTLTDQVRSGIAGINKTDFSVFSLSARDPATYAAAPIPVPVVSAPVAAPPSAPEPPPVAAPPVAASAPGPAEPPYERPSIEFTERRKVQREIYVARPTSTVDDSLTPSDVNLILRVDKLKQQELAEQLMVERLRREQHTSHEVAFRAESPASLPMRFQPPVREREAAAHASRDDEDESAPLTARLLQLAWSGRLVIITVLLIAAAISAYGYLQPRAANAGPSLSFANVGDKIQTPGWTYAVVSVERPRSLAATPPTSGGFLVIHITATKKVSDAPPLDPIAFTLIDSTGARALAFPSNSDIYAPATGLLWATRYPVNTIVHDHLVYDINPTVKGLTLLVQPANVQVRLPDP
jgi:hypothetical protein